MHDDEIKKLRIEKKKKRKSEWQRSTEAISSSFNSRSIYSSVFRADTYSLWADRLKDASEYLFSPSGLLAAGTPHTSSSPFEQISAFLMQVPEVVPINLCYFLDNLCVSFACVALGIAALQPVSVGKLLFG